MELNEFIGKFKEQFIDADKIELLPDTNFRTIESFDSLTGMATLLMIEEHFTKNMPEDVFRSLNTPRELYEYLTK